MQNFCPCNIWDKVSSTTQGKCKKHPGFSFVPSHFFLLGTLGNLLSFSESSVSLFYYIEIILFCHVSDDTNDSMLGEVAMYTNPR
jgi:hypothetical protein